MCSPLTPSWRPNLFQLQHELRGFTYAPGPYRQFLDLAIPNHG